MKPTDRLFQKSVSGKFRLIPAGYSMRIADTLNSLPEVIPCVSEETAVHVIAHKKNYRYMPAVSAAVLIIIGGSACLHFVNSPGDSKNTPRTTVRVTNVPVISSERYENIKEPSVTYESLSSQTDNKKSESQTENNVYSHDIAGDPDLINKPNGFSTAAQSDSGKGDIKVPAADNKKVKNIKPPSDKEPSVPYHTVSVIDSPPAGVHELPDFDRRSETNKNGSDQNDNKEIKGNSAFEGQDSCENGKCQAEEISAYFSGENNVGSKATDIPENHKKKLPENLKTEKPLIIIPDSNPEKISEEIPENHPQKALDIKPDKMPVNPEPYLPPIPEYEN